MPSVAQLVAWIERFAPPRYAMEGDRTGLQVGSPAREVRNVLTTLDLTPAVAEEAIARDCQLIVSHHAVIFRQLTSLRTDQPRGAMLQKLLAADIAVYVPHTAVDVTPGGINDRLASRLGIVEPRPLRRLGDEPGILLDVLSEDALPVHHLGLDVDEAHELPGKSSWRYQLTTGKTSYRHVVSRLEGMGARVIAAVETLSSRSSWGIGRVGALAEASTLDAFAARVRQQLEVPALRVVGEAGRPVSTVAVLCGDGNRFLDDALRAGADVLVTGDVYYHTALAARAAGIGLIDPGHHATEQLVKGLLVEALAKAAAEEDAEVGFLAAETITEPFRFLA